MQKLKLVRPLPEHKFLYETMMDEWETFGGRINPGALRRYSKVRQKNIPYEEWLELKKQDRESSQDLYFFMDNRMLLGGVSIRYKSAGIDGHCGFGIRPSERHKGYATKMLSMALPIMKEYGISPVILSCAKVNIGSAKTILYNGGRFIEEVVEEDTGEVVQVYHIPV